MLFYLDKDLAEKGIAKCISISEKELSLKDVEEAKNFFNTKSIIIYNGEYIPSNFSYNYELDNIVEEKEKIEKESFSLNNHLEKVFDESYSYDPEKKYFYIEKEYADNYYKSKIIAVYDLPLKQPNLFFQKKVYCYVGKNVPYYISIENNVIREATEYEKYIRGQRNLEIGEYINNNEISFYNIKYEYIDKNGIKQSKSRSQLIDEKIITIESEKEKARKDRKKAFESLDLYDKAVLRGDILENKDDKKERDNYRSNWLKLPNIYSNLNIPIEDLYPIIPQKIKYFC